MTAGISRRVFLGSAAAAPLLLRRAAGADPPTVTDPRATDGDARFEPDWDERLSITVGNRDADLVGADDKVLQAAIDYMARRGGGTVRILPGRFTLRNAVQLARGVRLLGSGPESVITKIPSETVSLAADSDWYDQEITLDKPGAFRVGDGVVLRTKNPHNGGRETIKRTLVARSGNRFKLDDGLRKNLWLSGSPTCSSLFPLLTAERTAGLFIENLTLDGNGDNNENLDGNHAGCIFLQDCRQVLIRGVTVRNYNGDGISFQICHDVTVDGCHSHDNRGLGLHPGSGSQRPRIRGNRLERNRIGIFWCWGVKFGLAEGNRIDANRDYGISIGHNDTDNVMRDNEVTNSGKTGILFRDDARGADFWPHRNVVEQNRVTNSGDGQGVAIDVQGKTRDIKLADNEIVETRGAMRRVAIRLGPEVGPVELASNRIRGFATELDDRRQRDS